MKRYQIQYVALEDTIGVKNPEWVIFYRASGKRTLKGARKEWWEWVNYPWEDHPLFRIWDTKENKVVE